MSRFLADDGISVLPKASAQPPRRLTADTVSRRPVREGGHRAVKPSARWLWARYLAFCLYPLAACGYAFVYTLALRQAGSDLVHGLFWVSTLFAVAATLLLIRAGCRPLEAGIATILIGAVFYLPKYFRSPHFFDYHDELAHWFATEELLRGHGAFVTNPDNLILKSYPGLHIITAALSSMTGLSVFAAGNIVVAWAHIASCLAIYSICRQLHPAQGVALSAVLLYGANPAFFYFDSQFSYESLGIIFLLVGILAAIRLLTPGVPVSWAETGLIGIVVLALIVTHHATSYMLALILVAFAALSSVRRRRNYRRASRQLVFLALLAVVGALVWLLAVARYTYSYLEAPIAADLAAIPRFFESTGHASRQLFNGIPIPAYEVLGSYISVLILLILYICTIVSFYRQRKKRDRRQSTFLLLGAVYFVTLPAIFILNDQTAKRPWVFAFIGLAVTCAPLVHRLLRRSRRLAWFGCLPLVLLLYIGGVVTLSGADIRFPGSFNASSDALATTPDVVAAASWLDTNYGADNPVIGDKVVANVFGAYGFQDVLTYEDYGYQPWRVVFPKYLGPGVYQELHSDGARFIVIDQRIAVGAPIYTYYFDSVEPGAGTGVRPFDMQSLNKFQHGPFMEIYNNGNIIIYEYLDWSKPPAQTEAGA